MTIAQYTKAIEILSRGAGNRLPENTQAHVLQSIKPQNWLTELFAALAKTLIDAQSILFKDGLYRKPNYFRFVALGRVALNLILSLIKLLKNV